MKESQLDVYNERIKTVVAKVIRLMNSEEISRFKSQSGEDFGFQMEVKSLRETLLAHETWEEGRDAYLKNLHYTQEQLDRGTRKP